MIKHPTKSITIDNFGLINEIVFLKDKYIILSDVYKNDKYCNIIETNFSDYRSTYNLLEKEKINRFNFFQKIDDSTLLINSLFDFRKDFLKLKDINVIFPKKIYEIYKSKIILKEKKYKVLYSWYHKQNYITLCEYDEFYKLKNNWLKNIPKYKIIILNENGQVIKEIKISFNIKKGILNWINHENSNIILYINNIKVNGKYLSFICNNNLFLINIETSSIIKYHINDKFCQIQDVSNNGEIIITTLKKIILLKSNETVIIKSIELIFKNKILIAKFNKNHLIVLLPKMVKIFKIKDFVLLKEYGFEKFIDPRIFNTSENRFVIIYKSLNKISLSYNQKISFLEI